MKLFAKLMMLLNLIVVVFFLLVVFTRVLEPFGIYIGKRHWSFSVAYLIVGFSALYFGVYRQMKKK